MAAHKIYQSGSIRPYLGNPCCQNRNKGGECLKIRGVELDRAASWFTHQERATDTSLPPKTVFCNVSVGHTTDTTFSYSMTRSTIKRCLVVRFFSMVRASSSLLPYLQPHTLHSKPQTLHPTPYALNSKPCPPNPKFGSLNHQPLPQSLILTPYTPNTGPQPPHAQP